MPLPTPHSKQVQDRLKETIIVQAHVKRTVVADLNAMGFPYGWQQSLLSNFMGKFHEAIKEAGIEFAWDPESVEKALELFNNLTFNGPAKS